MAYTAWSVVFGEQPTAAKWNQLGANDAGFKDGTNIDSAAIITRHLASGITLTNPVLNKYSVAGKTLLSIVQTNLASNYTSTANNTEQECANLRVTLPVIAGTCTLKITFKGYVTSGSGNNDFYVRLGTSTSYLTNTQVDGLYVSGAKSVESLTGIKVTTADLTVQNYISISVKNDASNSIALSSSGSRTCMVVEIYA